MTFVIRKAFAYITYRDRLLVFSHPLEPEAGIQVPAGTIEEDEAPDVAALREAREETGLTALRLVRFLGEEQRDLRHLWRDEIHHRYFYHLECTEEPPDQWQYTEQFASDGSGEHLFEFFWVRLPDEVPDLIADHGSLLPTLLPFLALPPS